MAFGLQYHAPSSHAYVVCFLPSVSRKAFIWRIGHTDFNNYFATNNCHPIFPVMVGKALLQTFISVEHFAIYWQ
jgi:hypothetical protein